MSRLLDRSAGPLATLLLAVACFGPVLFRGEQFVFRDASLYYYPLHARTVAQWGTGQVPLWDPQENGGQPLMGNPTAAVLYPGKLVFAALPFAWASRIYLIGHVGLALAAMGFALRGLGVSRTGAVLGGLSYGFGGPVLFQYSNAIYLVGAAWLPLGLLAAYRWVELGRPRALVGLALVLSMQVLGGDIQVAYAMGLLSAIYAAWVALRDRVSTPSPRQIGIASGLWIVGTLFVAAWLPSFREIPIPDWAVARIGLAAKSTVLVGLVAWILRTAKGRRAGLVRGGAGLLAAGLLGAAIAGAQLVPVAELSSLSFRMADDTSLDPYGYSLEPYRIAEWIWPGVFGIEFPENRWWLRAIPPIDGHLAWVSTLFAGSLTVWLALAALSGREAPPWQTPLAACAAVGMALSFGRYGSPLWWARYVPEIESLLGPQGASGASLFRAEDGLVRDAFGSPFWLVSNLAPGFGSFRFPPKFLVFASLGISALAGLGWDRVSSGRSGAFSRLVLSIAGLSLVLLLLSFAFEGPIMAWISARAKVPSLAGPIDPAGSVAEFRRAMLHTILGLGLAGGVLSGARRGRSWAGFAAVMLLAIDLAFANSRHVWTAPQAEFEKPSRLAGLIREAEARDHPASAEPFRIHRMPEWQPLRWVRTRSPDRLRELVAWQRDTAQSGLGMLYGLSYTLTPGVIEPEAYLDFFSPWTIEPGPSAVRSLGLRPKQPIRYYPRRAFDLWGARDFILPRAPFNWMESNRAIASFLPGTELVAPSANVFADNALQNPWIEDEDWQLLRNEQRFPRAWVVHDVRFRPAAMRPGSPENLALKRTILYAADPAWNIPGRTVEDPRTTAWVQAASAPIGMTLDGDPPSSSERVTVVRYEPAAIELEATLGRDGLVVLAEQDYPGWTLAIDGRPAPILKTNLAMRGAFVPSGTHRLRFRYEPRSFRIGLGFTAGGLLAAAIVLFMTRKRREESA